MRKTYGKTTALAGVNLNVKQGETVVIMGPSGCGKSTLIRCINRLTEPDSGEVLVQGRSVLQLSDEELMAFRRKVGFVFQQFHLIGRLTVLENVMFHLVLAGADRTWAKEQAAAALAKWASTASMPASQRSSTAGSSSGWPSPGPGCRARTDALG